MPVLETDFLKGLIDPDDELHKYSKKSLEKVKNLEWKIASSSFIELDLILKSSKVKTEECKSTFEALESEIPKDAIITLTPEAVVEAIKIREKHPDIPSFYFDSIHIGTTVTQDRKIVSSDSEFDKIESVERIPLEEI